MTFALDATSKALDNIDASRAAKSGRRKKREGNEEELQEDQNNNEDQSEDLEDRLARLKGMEDRMHELRQSVDQIKAEIQRKLFNARQSLAGIDVGVNFNRGSTLELRTPPNLAELAVTTEVSFYANVSRRTTAPTPLPSPEPLEGI